MPKTKVCERCGKPLELETFRVDATCEQCSLNEVDQVDELHHDLEEWAASDWLDAA